MPIAADFSVNIAGNIRYTGAGTNYTVLEFHRWLQDLADDAIASGDDLVDITSATPSDRSTDNIVALLGSYNIDDTAAEHLYDGSITQAGGDVVYSGLEVVGSVVAGTQLQIIQDNKMLVPYWGTGINANLANNVIMRVMIKTRTGGADIDSKRLRVQSRELGDKYGEFSLTAGLGNSTAAVFTSADLNNATAEATVAGWTTIANTEGYQLIDITGDSVGEPYYSQWDIGSQSINDTYERTKWIQQRSSSAATAAEVGTDYVVDDATITGQGQEFTSRAQSEILTSCTLGLKVGLGTPTGAMTAELFLSDGAGTAAPTGAVLATSEPLDANRLTASYQDVIFNFTDNVTMNASTAYFIVIRHATGDASNYIHVQGNAAGTAAGNLATDTGGWSGVAAADLGFTVSSSPVQHSIAGQLFRGITHDVIYDGESLGPFSENETVFWGAAITYDTLVGTFTVGEYVKFENAGVVVNGGKVLKDTGTVLTLALEDLSQNLVDGDAITGLSSGATAAINVTITDDNRAGGEGLLLALNDQGTTGNLYVQLLNGAAPVDNLQIEGRTSGATALVNVTVTSRTISPEFIGASTGSNIIGAYGIGFQTTDVGSSDQFFDLDNTLRVPPNNVTFTVTGLVSGEDRVLVGPRAAGVLEKNQDTLATTLSGAAEVAIVMTTAIPSDTPAIGDVRVQLDSGVYREQPYLSYTGSTYTIASANYSADNATLSNNVFIAYIDELAGAATASYTAVYSVDRSLFVRVRDGGSTPIKTFESPATFGSSDASIAAIRTSDA